MLSLVTSVTIPKEYVKPAINHCPSSKTVKDKLSAPSVSDSDESDWWLKWLMKEFNTRNNDLSTNVTYSDKSVTPKTIDMWNKNYV